MKRSTYAVPKMDCPAEERLIRLALESLPAVQSLSFDLDARRLVVGHTGTASKITDRLLPLGLGAALESTTDASATEPSGTDPAGERRVLRQLLAINAVMFVVELLVGLLAHSAGLLADSLDMLADAAVYGISLYVVGRAAAAKRRAARVAGWLEGVLAVGVLAEVGRRAVFGSEPVESLMIGMGLVALAANLLCVALLARHREGGVHLRASWIFSTNDALANLGLVMAGVLVGVTGSSLPDLVIGTAVGLLVLSGALRILRL